MATEKREPMDAEGFRLWRERMGFSTRVAAEKLGCSRGALNNWEQGHTKIPHYIALATAALALGIEATGNAGPGDV